MDWNKLSEELLKRLDALGSKIGQAGGYLWHLAVRQAYISGFEYLFFALAGAVAICLCAKNLPRAVAFFRASEKRYDRFAEGWAVAGCVVGIVIGFAVFAPCAVGAANALANPELYALKMLLEQVR